ncbi:MAG: topA [Rhizobacter sp.]|nr:topA [Rhizobacter sp.]
MRASDFPLSRSPAADAPASADATAPDAPAAAQANGTPELLTKLANGLVYVSDEMPGLTRVLRGEHFAYKKPNGQWHDDEEDLARIRKLAVPPAYTDVWVCLLPNGHLQATGRDARGRKQYRYHPEWRLLRDEGKFERMLAFSAVLPKLRARVAKDMALEGLPRNKVLATLVRLLDTTAIRVGNDEYARTNHSYGLTTLRGRHAKTRGDLLRLEFKGKSGIQHKLELHDKRVVGIVRKCQELPGQELFQFLDADGQRHGIGSSDVNDYLREVTGGEFTAKDFRTWNASVHALDLLCEREAASQAEARRIVNEALGEVAAKLGNTVAVCRKAYVHPQVLTCFVDGTLAAPTEEVAAESAVNGSKRLPADERRLVQFLLRCEAQAKAVVGAVKPPKDKPSKAGPGKSAKTAKTAKTAKAALPA